MVKFFALIPRAEGVSSQYFHDHWRHPHGTFGRLISTSQSYVQSHQLDSEYLGAEQAQFEGIAEVTFDTVQDGIGLAEEPQYKTFVAPDEPNFVDVPRLEWLYADEEVLVSRAIPVNGRDDANALWMYLERPVSTKLLQFVRSDGNPDWAGSDDADLGSRIGALRHVRNYASREVHGDESGYLGARELWWPTITDFEDGIGADRAAFDELLRRGGSSVTLLAQAERFLR